LNTRRSFPPVKDFFLMRIAKKRGGQKNDGGDDEKMSHRDPCGDFIRIISNISSFVMFFKKWRFYLEVLVGGV